MRVLLLLPFVVMKVATTRLLRRFGFRMVLVVNGLLGAMAVAACGLLESDSSLTLVCGVLVFAGMTRSMQFTSLNNMAFADIPDAARAGATTMAAVAQQVGAALSVAFAFFACAVLLVISALWSLRLPHDAGAEVTSQG